VISYWEVDGCDSRESRVENRNKCSAIFDRVLTVNLAANTVIFYIAARLYLLPLVPRVRPQLILVPILLLHSTRHLGLMFLTRGGTFSGNAGAVCVSSRIWRSDNRDTHLCSYSARAAQFSFSQASSVAPFG
jgi:hypothetical protein